MIKIRETKHITFLQFWINISLIAIKITRFTALIFLELYYLYFYSYSSNLEYRIISFVIVITDVEYEVMKSYSFQPTANKEKVPNSVVRYWVYAIDDAFFVFVRQ